MWVTYVVPFDIAVSYSLCYRGWRWYGNPMCIFFVSDIADFTHVGWRQGWRAHAGSHFSIMVPVGRLGRSFCKGSNIIGLEISIVKKF